MRWGRCLSHVGTEGWFGSCPGTTRPFCQTAAICRAEKEPPSRFVLFRLEYIFFDHLQSGLNELGLAAFSLAPERLRRPLLPSQCFVGSLH